MPTVYKPIDNERVVWYGGQSTQLHLELRHKGKWIELEVITLTQFPTQMKELLEKMREFYNDCVIW